MKATLSILVLLLAATVAAPQGASQDPRFTVKMQPEPEDSIKSKFTITNRSQVPITAVVITCDDRDSQAGLPRYVRYHADSVIDDQVQIAYQESATFTVREPDFVSMTCNQDSSVRAVLFADGSSFGETNWVNEILLGRQSTLKLVEELLNLLQNAKNSGITKAQLVAQLMKWARSPHPVTMPDRTVEPGNAPSVFYVLSRNLGRAREYANDSVISQSLVDELSAPVLDVRQLLLYSKPALPDLPTNLDPAAAPPPDFTIKFPSGLGSEEDSSIGNMISVFYTLNAEGRKEQNLFDRFSPGDDDDTAKIHALVAGHPASSLKVAIYAPGCQIKIVNVPDPYAHIGNENFECVKLPTIKFSGQILSSGLLLGKKYKVQIELHNSGDKETPWFAVDLADEITPDENGMFHIEIPDFSQDPASSSHGATLRFSAELFSAGASTTVHLAAENGASDSSGNLRLVSGYGGPVTFEPRPKQK